MPAITQSHCLVMSFIEKKEKKTFSSKKPINIGIFETPNALIMTFGVDCDELHFLKASP